MFYDREYYVTYGDHMLQDSELDAFLDNYKHSILNMIQSSDGDNDNVNNGEDDNINEPVNGGRQKIIELDNGSEALVVVRPNRSNYNLLLHDKTTMKKLHQSAYECTLYIHKI